MSGTLLRTRNVLKSWLLLVGACAVFSLPGITFGNYRLLSILVFAALLLATGLYVYSDRVALGMVGAKELVQGEAPALHSTVERLAARAGVAKPRLYVMRDGFPRALVAGRGPRGSALAVSRGLAPAMPPAGLGGVLPHELAHLRNRDVLLQTTVSVLAAAVVEASRIGGGGGRGAAVLAPPVSAAPPPP